MLFGENPYSIPLGTGFRHAKGGYWFYKGTDVGAKNKLYLVFVKHDYDFRYWRIRSPNPETLERSFPDLIKYRRENA